MVKRIFLATIALIIIAFVEGSCSAAVKVRMLNVGQGDAILIQTDKENVLVDTSDVDERDKLMIELRKAEVERLDKLILTHPHADHIGNAAYLISLGTIKVKAVYDNGAVSTSKFYQNYLAECRNRNVVHSTLKATDKIFLDDDAYLEIFSPTLEKISLANNGGRRDPNNESIVGKLVCKNFSMLFTGDAEFVAEADILAAGDDIKCDVLKAAHHGSKTSSSVNFLRKVNPKYVLISAGEPTSKRGGNTYGHPHASVLQSLLHIGVKPENIFWTHKNGTVTVESDGESYSVYPEIKSDWVKNYLKNKAYSMTEIIRLN